MSKKDKSLFYYLGLILLVLIVLGALFGISGVKESYQSQKQTLKKKMRRCCLKEADLPKEAKKQKQQRRDLCSREVKQGRFTTTRC